VNLKSIDAMGVGLIGVAIAGMYVAGVRPLQTVYADSVSLKAELWIAQNKLKDSQASEKRASESANNLSQKLENLEIELSSIDQMNTRLSLVTSIADKAGLTLESVRPGAEAKTDRYRAVAISLVGRTGYEEAGVFLEDLLRQFPDTGLETIRFERINNQGLITGRLQLDMVWYAAPNGTNGSAG
jgi:Tfp pilus assembly protein PilO